MERTHGTTTKKDDIRKEGGSFIATITTTTTVPPRIVLVSCTYIYADDPAIDAKAACSSLPCRNMFRSRVDTVQQQQDVSHGARKLFFCCSAVCVCAFGVRSATDYLPLYRHIIATEQLRGVWE